MARKRTLAKVTAKTEAAAAETAKAAAEKTEAVKEAAVEKTEAVKEAVAEKTEEVKEAVKEAAEKTVKTAKKTAAKKTAKKEIKVRSRGKRYDRCSQKRLDKGKWKKSGRYQRYHTLCKAGGSCSLLCGKRDRFRKSCILMYGKRQRRYHMVRGRYGIFFCVPECLNQQII